jgi:hypothetical protein
MRICGKCQVALEESCFAKDGSRKDGLQLWCRKCHSDYAKTPEQKKRWSERAGRDWSSGKTRNSRYQKLFGITLEDYVLMFAEQKGCCKLCGRSDTGRKYAKHLCVDHCHKTGRVRGLLCNRCNAGIGFLCDDHGLADKARAYLAENQESDLRGHA